MFLEGIGAMLTDYPEHVANAACSKRTSEILLERLCTHFNCEPVVFDAVDGDGVPIYLTNVLMEISTGFAMIGLEIIQDPSRRHEVAERLHRGERSIINLTDVQIGEFSGSAIELQGKDGLVLALVFRELASLSGEQKRVLERHVIRLPLDIPIIEFAGGSVRCMIAGLHLSRRPDTRLSEVAT